MYCSFRKSDVELLAKMKKENAEKLNGPDVTSLQRKTLICLEIKLYNFGDFNTVDEILDSDQRGKNESSPVLSFNQLPQALLRNLGFGAKRYYFVVLLLLFLEITPNPGQLLLVFHFKIIPQLVSVWTKFYKYNHTFISLSK